MGQDNKRMTGTADFLAYFQSEVLKEQRRSRMFNLAISVVAAMIIIILISTAFFLSRQQPTAVVYNVTLHETTLCVGGPLTFDSEVHIYDDVVIRFVAAVVIPNGRTVLQLNPGLQATVRRAGETLQTPGRSIDLEGLGPGIYEYRLGAESTGLHSGFIFVPFEIVDCGGDGVH